MILMGFTHRLSVHLFRLSSCFVLYCYKLFYGIRSHRQLFEPLDYNLLFRWFVGLSADSPIFVHSSFSMNQNRLERHDVFGKFMAALLQHDDVLPLLSDEHFSLDGTLIDAWASYKSFKPKDGSGDGDGGKLPHVSNTPQDDGVRFWLG